MSAVEALALAQAEGVLVSLAGDFIRYQSRGPPSERVLAALKAAKPEIVALLSRFRLDATGALAGGDDLLCGLARLGFRVRRCGDQAALDDETEQGRVPPDAASLWVRQSPAGIRRGAAGASGARQVMRRRRNKS
jgi:hypothetical protein